MDRLGLEVGMQLLLEGTAGHQIHGATQQVFDIELRADVAFGGRAPLETNQDIDVAVIARPATGEGAEQGETGNAEAHLRGAARRPGWSVREIRHRGNVRGRRSASRRVGGGSRAPQGHADGAAAVLVRGRVRAGRGNSTAEAGGPMACTEAVERLIGGYYARRELLLCESEFREKIREFRTEELEHRDVARAKGAAAMPGYGALKTNNQNVDPDSDLVVRASVVVGPSTPALEVGRPTMTGQLQLHSRTMV